MTSNLESSLGIDPQTLDLDATYGNPGPRSRELITVGFLTIWELQSQLATLSLILLVALVPVSLAVLVMLGWALAAAFAYHHARMRGLPDLLATQCSLKPATSRAWPQWLGLTLVSALKIWLAGISPFVFSRLVRPILAGPASSTHRRVARVVALGMAFTLFGVTTSHHLLGKAGISGGALLRASLIGPFLNVPYRIMLSAAVLGASSRLLGGLPVF